MRPIKICYKIKYFLKKLFGVEAGNIYFELLITRYYKIFKSKRNGVNFEKKRKRKLIVSMTSIPSRIDKVWITVESLLRQTYKPDHIILWLAEDEFRDIKLPVQLKAQQKRGLQICYCDNLRSYKKFYYTAMEYPDDYIVTVDDDTIYAEDMLETLLRTYQKHRGCIISNRSHYIKKYSGGLRAYNSWIKFEEREHIEDKPSFYNFFTGCGGNMFPMYMMNKKVLDKKAFMELAPYADDVWLNFCAWISGIKIVNTKGILGYVISIDCGIDKGLADVNVTYRKNDEQIKQVLKYLEIDINQYL